MIVVPIDKFQRHSKRLSSIELNKEPQPIYIYIQFPTDNVRQCLHLTGSDSNNRWLNKYKLSCLICDILDIWVAVHIKIAMRFPCDTFMKCVDTFHAMALHVKTTNNTVHGEILSVHTFRKHWPTSKKHSGTFFLFV